MQEALFVCKKCEHHLFIEINEEFIRILDKLTNYTCPKCGANREMNWSYFRIVNSDDDIGEFNWFNK